jgi:hypothetical protein
MRNVEVTSLQFYVHHLNLKYLEIIEIIFLLEERWCVEIHFEFQTQL